MDDLSKVIAELSPDELQLLHRYLRELGQQNGRPARARIVRQSRDSNVFPLSFAQQRLWFLDQLTPGSAAYNIPMSVRLTGRLDVAALERGVQEIVHRHEILRTTFTAVEGQPVQVVAPGADSGLSVLDLSGLDEGEREAAVGRLAAEEFRRPFDLESGPLMRVTLLRLDAERHILLRTIHHTIFDNFSEDIFVRELLALYEAFSHGKPSPLPEPPIQYADYAHWQREWMQGEVMREQLAYWQENLAGAPPALNLPTDRPRPAVQTFRGAKQLFAISGELTAGVEALSRSENCTPFMTLLAAFQSLLQHYSGQADVLVGTATSGRTRPETERLVGLFANTLVLRTDLAGDPTFKELLRRVREVVLSAEARQDVPFEKLVEVLQVERDLSRQPIFQVLFNLQSQSLGTSGLPGMTLEPMESEVGTSKFDLTVFWAKAPSHFYGSLVYSTDLFEPATAARMTEDYVALLEAVVARPGARLGELLETVAQERLRKRSAARAALNKSNLDRLRTARRKGADS
ncbi:MAG: condensation domain-containing protein [Acidobacteria bacterium]|nr:condensation domain-containing protein [Acidobacteriota bacterium]